MVLELLEPGALLFNNVEQPFSVAMLRDILFLKVYVVNPSFQTHCIVCGKALPLAFRNFLAICYQN